MHISKKQKKNKNKYTTHANDAIYLVKQKQSIWKQHMSATPSTNIHDTREMLQKERQWG